MTAKLTEDLQTVEIMVDEMESYLNSDNLFGPTLHADQPLITLGGYFLREHRLQALADQRLDSGERARLEAARSKFASLAAEQQHRIREKVQQELDARINQWRGYIEELEEAPENADYYRVEVEKRAILAALRRQTPEYVSAFQLSPDLIRQIDELDTRLRRRWRAGSFVWPDAWKPAYPDSAYWWLYGRPSES